MTVLMEKGERNARKPQSYPQHANFVVRLPCQAGVVMPSTGFRWLDVGRVAGVGTGVWRGRLNACHGWHWLDAFVVAVVLCVYSGWLALLLWLPVGGTTHFATSRDSWLEWGRGRHGVGALWRG